MASFTLSPASGMANASVPVVASGVGTVWTGATGFVVSGGVSPYISGLTIISATQAVFTINTGLGSGTLTVSDTTDSLTATFLVGAAVLSDAFTYDVSTPIGQLRLQLGDMDVSQADITEPREEWSCLFSDSELQYFLNKWGQNVDYATIEGLRFMAARPMMLIHAIRLHNLDMEQGDLAKTLTDLADAILVGRTKVPAEQYAEVGLTDASRRTIIFNRILRSMGGTQI